MIQAFAAVSSQNRPSDATSNLVIGILNDNRADGTGDFPNEPAITGYDYHYLLYRNNTLSLTTSYGRSSFFTSSAGTYINTEGFWNDDRINMNVDGDAFGYYNPNGLDLSDTSLFTSQLASVIDEEAIISE